MANNEDESQNSLPYIDDTLTDDDVRSDKCQYNLRIIENYQNKGRNIEIRNTQLDDFGAASLSPVAPLAEETEVSDWQEDDNTESKENVMPRPTALKLIIKGCNSMISIQGLDNKSSITFRRRSERIRSEKSVALDHRQEICRKASIKPVDSMKSSPDKSKKGRWRKLTRSLISKSTKFERRTSDERYPKYVLLKNEEEEEEERLLKKGPGESYPKMVIFNAKSSRRIGSSINVKRKESADKREFSLKKSFKNRTEPVIPMDEILAQTSKPFDGKAMKPLNEAKQGVDSREKKSREKVKDGKRGCDAEESGPLEGEQEVVFDFTHHPVFQGNLFNEIQGILEEALRLYSDVKAPNQAKEPEQPPPEEPPQESFPSVPPQLCQFPCHDPHYCQPPMYIPVYNQYEKPRHSRSFYTQTNETDVGGNNQNNSDLHFGILSSFFPGTVVMKTYQCESLDKKMEDVDVHENEIMEISNIFTSDLNDTQTLKVPVPDLTIKSKMVFEEEKRKGEKATNDINLEECLPPPNSNSEEEEKTKADDSEATEYLYYNESESQENESTTTTLTISKTHKEDEEEKEKRDDSHENLSLTKVGYKMYDSLTKLSLGIEKAEEKEERGSQTKPAACFHVSVESERGVVKVRVPQDEVMLGFNRNAETAEIQIGISKLGAADVEGKKLVQKNELWHPDNGSDMLVVKKGKYQDGRGDRKDSRKIKLSMDDNKEVVLSIEMDEGKMEKGKPIERATKEMKVGTDDIDLAGGDLLCTKGSNYQNLSPRTGQILKSLEEKLTFSERERKILADRIKRKLEDEILERTIFPGMFLVRQICPAPCTPRKPLQVPCLKKTKKVSDLEDLNKLREYYCEECLATMRIFEDENPSVKSMVDKFETIIQLDKY